MSKKQLNHVLLFLVGITVITLSSFMFASCDASGISSGDLEISIPGEQGRSILPSSALRSVNTISISGTGPNDVSLQTQYFRLGGKIAISGLSAGTWKIYVTGFNGTETEPGTQLTSPSEQTVTIKSGVTTSATFNLHYLTAGRGDALVTVHWPSDNSSIGFVSATIKTRTESEPFVGAPVTNPGSVALDFSDLNVGNYDFDLLLTNLSGTTISLPMIDMVNIFNALDSTGTIELAAADLPFVSVPVITVSEQPTTQQTEENHRTVTLFSATPEATIYYSVLDAEETGVFDFDNKIEYSEPFAIEVPDDATSITQYVRAIAVKDGYQDSLPASETITVTGAGGTGIDVTKPTLISNVTVVRDNDTATNPAFAVTYNIQGNLSINSFAWYVDGVVVADSDDDGNGNTFTYDGTLAAGQHQIMVKLGYLDGEGSQQTVSGSLRLSISDAIATPVISTESVTGGTMVSITCATKGASLYYTTDGITTPSSAGTCYSNPFVIDETSTIQAIAIMDGAFNSSVATSGVLTVDALLAPTFSLSEGTYTGNKSVTITCDGADSIHYTLDGTDPTGDSQEYSAPLSIKETSTLKAMAVAVGKANAPIAEATYTITYKVGDTGPAGGVVFYVNPSASSDGWTYLEIAPSAELSAVWATSESQAVTVGDTEQAIGSGEANTLQMVNKADAGAAVICAGKTTGNGYDDWFLPSLEELKAYTDLPAGTYWSSSEASTSNAWVVVKEVASVASQSVSKTTVNSIYAVRSFL